MSQENGNIQILCTRTVSSEPSFSLKQRKLKIPKKSEVAANALFANHRQSDVNVYDVLYIIIGSSRVCENNVAHPSMCEVKIKKTATFYMYLIIISNALS